MAISATGQRQWEKELRRLGGRTTDVRERFQLQVVRPENHGSWDWVNERTWDFCDAVASCLGWTQRGDRGFTYVTGGEDARLEGVIDYQENAFSHDAYRFIASAVFRPFRQAITRAELQAAHPALASVFATGQRIGARELNRVQHSALVDLVEEREGRLPSFILMPKEECDHEAEDWGKVGNPWGLERTMQEAIARNRRGGWGRLFSIRPQQERRELHGRDIYDLVSEDDRAVAELKIDANTLTLLQLKRYLDGRKQETRRRWSGHIIYGRSCTAPLVEAVEGERRNSGYTVKIWRCERTPTGKPRLVPHP